MTAGALLTLLLGFPRRSDIPEYDVADLPALREIDIDALLPQIPDADPLFQAALRNPAALRSTNDRALELKAQGRLEEAVPLMREALAGRREVLGLRHADTLYSATQLALLLQDQGKVVEATQWAIAKGAKYDVCQLSFANSLAAFGFSSVPASKFGELPMGGIDKGPDYNMGLGRPEMLLYDDTPRTGRPTRPAPTTAAHSAPPTPSGTRTRRRASRCTTRAR